METAHNDRRAPRDQRVALGAVLIVLVAGLLGIGVVGGRGDDLPLLPIGAAGGAERAMGDAGASMLALPVDYELDPSVSDPAREGPAYRMGRDADVARIERLRDALGLKGAIAHDSMSWTVTDGARVLRVQRLAGLPWYFGIEEKPVCGPDTPVASDGSMPADYEACARMGTVSSGSAAPDGGAGSAGATEPGPPSDGRSQPETVEPCPMPPCPEGQACTQACPSPEPVPAPVRPAGMPSRADAEVGAKAVLAASGVDADSVRWTVEDGFSAWYVAADPMIDGLRTFGWTHSVSVGPHGVVQNANGFLAAPDKVADYPLVTVQEALDRHEAIFRGDGIRLLPAADAATSGAAGQTEPGWAPYSDPECAKETVICDPPPGGVPGEAPEPMKQRIVGATLVLMHMGAWSEDSPAAHLVPAFLLEIEGGGELPLVAVEDRYIDQPSVDESPGPRPMPEPVPAERTP